MHLISTSTQTESNILMNIEMLCGPKPSTQVSLFDIAVSLFLSELSNEKCFDLTDDADNEQVAFVATEYPLKQVKVSSLISCVAPRAERLSTAIIRIQIICCH